MKCHVCGSKFQAMTTDLPFKANENSIVIMKNLPLHQCESCSEYLLDDSVMKRVEDMIQNIDTAAELEVIKFAA